MELNLMVQCCLINDYCPHNTPAELYIMSISIILGIITIIETITKCIRRY